MPWRPKFAHLRPKLARELVRLVDLARRSVRSCRLANRSVVSRIVSAISPRSKSSAAIGHVASPVRPPLAEHRAFEQPRLPVLCAVQQFDSGAHHMATTASTRSSSCPTRARRWAASRARLSTRQRDRAWRDRRQGRGRAGGHQRRAGRQGVHGQRAVGRPRPGSGPPGGARRGPSPLSRSGDRQQGLRIGHAGGDLRARHARLQARPT